MNRTLFSGGPCSRLSCARLFTEHGACPLHSRAMRLPVLAFSIIPLALVGCGGDTSTPADAGSDAPSDMTPSNCAGEAPAMETIHPPEVWITPGATAALTLRTAYDRCAPLVAMTSSTMPDIARAEVASVRVEPNGSTASFNVRATATGDATVRVGAAEVRVHVVASGAPACPTDTQPSNGRLAAGTTVRGATGTPLAAASVGAPMTATAEQVPPVDVSIRCAADQVPTGFTAIGPAVRFDPSTARMGREIPFTLPINPAMVPAGYELQVELSYSSPAFRTPRIAPAADVHFTADGRLTFRAPRLGTWQAVIRTGLGARRERKRFTYHGIVGVSMGSAGAAMIGTHNLDKFDFIAPLGGPVDWSFLGNYIRTYHMGGFCTAAERATDPMGCAMGSSVARTPAIGGDIFEFRQHYEDWYTPDGMEGPGGAFDRHSYVQFFRDFGRMFGNPVMAPNAGGTLPLGVAMNEDRRTDAQRCSMPLTLMGYYDRRYNPDGSIPVITYCDGGNPDGHAGRWDGNVDTYPIEVSLAVDVNRNGRRDRGEPVLMQAMEPFTDVGADGRASAMETGYDAMTNPDPAGDDYDRQFNPSGTEGNFVRDEGEPYEDVGVDGVACPAGRMCQYDLGERNGRFDMVPGAARFQEVNPRTRLASATPAQVARTEYWIDGGVRDLFLLGVASNHFAGALAQHGGDVHYFNNFASLGAERVPEDPWPFTALDWAHMPGHVMLRYGSLDASLSELVNGDGGHVGTASQAANRFFAAFMWMAQRWPGGDREIAPFQFNADDAGHCANGYSCTFDFRSDRANRTGPVSIYLPPGYHDPANAGLRYPVVYVLHGYGMSPQNLLPTGFLVGNYMVAPQNPSWQRPQKFIMVFPDGRCREGDGCVRGTFYTDSPVGNAQMESYFLDLYDFVDRTYRVKSAEEVEVVR